MVETETGSQGRKSSRGSAGGDIKRNAMNLSLAPSISPHRTAFSRFFSRSLSLSFLDILTLHLQQKYIDKTTQPRCIDEQLLS
jgi:hypothetical protein